MQRWGLPNPLPGRALLFSGGSMKSNVLGRDRDVGYSFLRVSGDSRGT